MPVVLFAQIGLADVQFVHKSEKLRIPFNQEDFSKPDLTSMPFTLDDGFPEAKKGEKLSSPPDVISLPKLHKALSDLAARGVTLIDRLFLIATWREAAMERLAEALDQALVSSADPMVLKSKADRFREQAEGDFTHATAQLAKKLLSGHPGLLPLHIGEITILKLGSAGYFDSLPPLPDNPSPGDLSRFDINRADFFDFEFLALLKQYMAELGSSTLYLCSYGGFPNLNKSLAKVLSSLIPRPDMVHLYASADSGHLNLINPQDMFLELHSSMNRAALEMDWMMVKHLFVEARAAKPGYFGDSEIAAMETLFLSLEAKQSDPQNWFSNFFTLIMTALYRNDYNSLLVWLKCLTEAALLGLLDLPENKLHHGYKLIKNTILSDYLPRLRGKGSVVLFENEAVVAKFNEVWNAFEVPEAVQFLPQYGDLLYEPSKKKKGDSGRSFEPNPHYQKITNLRNDLIHSGKPIPRDPQLIGSIMDFLGIAKDKLDAALLALGDSDWNTLADFEQRVLNTSKFFNLTKSIAGITDAGWLPLERVCMKEYLGIVHGTPTPASP